jgi:serine/threonine-protein kinase
MALEETNDADPCAGWAIGSSEIVCRLSASLYVALRGGQLVVLKQLEVEPAGLHELQLHADATAQLKHPNLAQVFGCETGDEGTFWVTELVGGATLEELRAACKKAGKSLPLGLVFAAIHEAALALGELHERRRAHGNLRDSNVLVGFGGTAKVLNPGVYDCLQRMPPDPQADVFALASLLYECLTGQGAGGTTFAPPSSFNHALEKPVDDLLARALGAQRGKRFKTGAELALALKSAAGAYMWKPAQRAEFVLGLFKVRRGREQQLLANAAVQLAALRAQRAAEKAAAEAAAAQAAFVATEPAIVMGELVEEAPPPLPRVEPAEPPVVLSVPRRALKIGLAAAAGIAASVGLVHALSGSPQLAGAAVLAPPIPVLVPIAVVPPAPAPAPEPAPAETVKVAAEEPPPAAEAAPPPPKVKRKKRSGAGDAPVPPWLMRKGRR